MTVCFITGATGVVGSAISELLLRDPNVELKLLIRAESERSLRERLDSLAAFWQRDPTEIRRRVEGLRGDTTLPLFGLDRERFEHLGEQCTHLIHCAAIVRMNLPLEEARASAVSAARTLFDLAALGRKHGRLGKVEILSTVGVGGRWPGVVPERWLTEPRQFHNTYEQAKAEAEAVAAEAARSGLPVTVHRPSMVVGDSRTGRILRFQIFYHLVEFLSGARTGGLFPPLGKAKIDLIPVDCVAGAVVWSSTNSETAGQVLQLCSGPDEALSITELQRRIQEKFSAAGLPVRGPFTVPLAVLRAAVPTLGLFLPAKQKRALNTLPIFLDYLAEEQSFSNARTRPLLTAAAIPIPRPREYLDAVLDYYLARHRRNENSAGDG